MATPFPRCPLSRTAGASAEKLKGCKQVPRAVRCRQPWPHLPYPGTPGFTTVRILLELLSSTTLLSAFPPHVSNSLTHTDTGTHSQRDMHGTALSNAPMLGRTAAWGGTRPALPRARNGLSAPHEVLRGPVPLVFQGKWKSHCLQLCVLELRDSTALTVVRNAPIQMQKSQI